MTNTVSSNFGWEVAGGKKATKKIDPKPKEKKDSPKVDIAPPIQTSSIIYDLIRDSDDEEINNNKKVKPAKTIAQSKVDSPKKSSRKEVKESLNLVNTSMASVQKKKPSSKQTLKSSDQDLEIALKDLKIDEFDKQLSQLESLFPNNNLVICENLVFFLNEKLEFIPEIDPSLCQEQTYPISVMDKNVLKFLNIQLTKLNKVEAEKLFDYCLNNLFFDNQKIPSNHGHKMAFQLIAKLNPNLSINIEKFNEKINANKHRHQRLLIALWALGQFGYYNLQNGLKIWFDSMYAQLSIKGCANFIIFYLDNLLKHHKVCSKSKIKIELNEYDKIYELINDKNLNVSKEAIQKLKSSFDVLRCILRQELIKDSSYFEGLLRRLPVEKCPKQDDFLELLLDALLHNKDSMLSWKQCYSKHLAQSLILMEKVSKDHLKEIKSLKYTRDTLKYFDEQTSNLIAKLNLSSKDLHAKSHHFTRSKSNKGHSETDLLRKFNHLVKSINQTHYKKVSLGQMAVKTLFYTILAASIFFYWDVNHNRSVYTNSVQKQLRRYGLLDHTLKVINAFKQLFNSIQKTLSYYIPIWQRKFKQTVVPFTEKVLKTSKEYGTLVWIKSEPYRDMIVVYSNQGIKYVEDNYPYVIKNLNSCGQLAMDYVITVSNFLVYHVLYFVNYFGVKLLGFQNGELENVLFDAFRFVLDLIANFLLHVSDYISQL